MTRPPVHRLLAVAACAAALASAVGCGGGGGEVAEPAAPPPAVTPASAAVAPVEVGQKLTTGTATPAAVKRALKAGDTLVLAFLARGPAEDASVRTSLQRVEATRDSGVRQFVFDHSGRGAGDLLDSLSIVETPTVAVIDGSGKLSGRWVGLVDASIVRQGIADAERG